MSNTARIISDISSIDEREWQRLDHRDNPFLSHAFLSALEQSGSITAEAGWQPHHLALFHNERLVAFAPTYLKGHSHGEFVFDWAWADAYHRNGFTYYPKLLTAIPLSPVTGPRLLTAVDTADANSLRQELVQLAISQCEELGLSSWHCNFTLPEEVDVLKAPDMLQREDAQFFWFNHQYANFDAFLADLRSRKRKQIRRERRQVQAAEVQFTWKDGNSLTEQDLDFVYLCYLNTFRTYGNHAALNREFFQILSQTMGSGLRVALAQRGDEQIAMSLFLCGGGRLYGRYWGCVEDIPGLHFEAAYYQGIEHCIAEGIEVFESGAQGEHKISRGFVPTATRSFHWIEHEGFRQAIARHLEQETSWKQDYREGLESSLPFRQEDS